MDLDEVEMSREELQMFIRDCVNRKELLTPNIIRKYNQLQLLIEKKEKLSSDLLRVCESVSECEATVRQLYTKLGWKYEDTNSDNNDCDDKNNALNSEGDCGDAELPRCPSPVPNGATPVICQKVQMKEVRILLKRLPINYRPRTLRRLPSTKSKEVQREDDLSDSPESDARWQPSDECYSTDVSISSSKSSGKKRKITKLDKCAKTDAKSTSVPPSALTTPKGTATNLPNVQTTAPTVKPEVKPQTRPLAISDKSKPANNLPIVPQALCVGMRVLARRKRMRWESGEIAEIVEKEDGSKKFKVIFEDKGKVLVSGHHIAYDAMPKLIHLSVGGRVVSKSASNQTFFSPGILAELPVRKNHMRFLVFFDDHSALYVALPVLRVVCKPLPDPLDDIRLEVHKHFMKNYLEQMPYVPVTQFKPGQKLKVERDGAFETCIVVQLDCSLMEVAFVKDEQKEWIFRGSIRLEHIIHMKDIN